MPLQQNLMKTLWNLPSAINRYDELEMIGSKEQYGKVIACAQMMVQISLTTTISDLPNVKHWHLVHEPLI